MRKTYNCKNSDKAVTFMFDADGQGRILAIATQEGEYWFSVGWYKTEANAIRASRKQLSALGYTLNA